MADTERRRGKTGYLLLLPAVVWLGLFFIIPFYSLAAASLYDPSGSVFRGYEMTWAFSNYSDALQQFWRPLVRSLLYGAIATSICLVLGYVLAYAIAFKAGRWKNLMLVLVIAPFFTSFLVRTLSWKLILADNGLIVNTLQFLHILSEDGRLLATPVAVVAGLTYNFLPFMVLPLFASIDKIDHRLIEAAGDLYAKPGRRLLQGHLAAVAARGRVGHAAHLHPRGRRLHQRPAAGQSQPADDRQRHPEPLHRRQRLPRGLRALDDPDAADPGDRLGLRPAGRDGGAAVIGRWLREHLVLILGILVLIYTFVPIFIVILMSFNEPDSRLVYRFDGFTLDNWLNPCADPSMCDAVVRSLEIGVLATFGATVIGTLAAFALVRHEFAGRSSSNLLIFLPMAAPEIVMGSSLLALFVAAGFGGKLGFGTILIAHIMFCLSFVVVTVRARLAGMGYTLEQAAMDLYATPSQTFWRVTFPLVFPGILGAALLSFSLSFDDFIVTNLNAGTTTTFPMYVYGVAQRGVPMQVNVIGTLMFLIAITIVLLAEYRSRRRMRALA